MITALSQTHKRCKEALEGISQPGVMELQVDGKVDKAVLEKLEEAQMMLALRACETVTLRKLPECKSQKSRTATLREAKRLVGKLEGPEIPAISFRRLDKAMSGEKP